MSPRSIHPRSLIPGLLCGLLVFLLLNAGGGPVQARGRVNGWALPLNLSNTSGGSSFPVIQQERSSRDLFVIWTDYGDDSGGEVLLRRRLGATGIWTATLNLSNSTDQDAGPASFADPAGSIHLAWTRRNPTVGTTLLYRVWDGASWSDAEVLDQTQTYYPGPYGLLFVRDAADQTCLFVTFGSGVTFTCLAQAGWEPLRPWTYVPGMRHLGALVLGPDGLFHATVYGENEDAPWGCDPWLDDVYYAVTDGTSWTIFDNLSGQGSIAFDSALAFDQQGRLHVLWSDTSPFCSIDSEQSAIYERILSGGSWGDRTEVTAYNLNQATEDLALDQDDHGWLHLAWSEGVFDTSGRATNLSIRYAVWKGNGWSAEEVVHQSVEDSLNVDLSWGTLGTDKVVWEEGPAAAEEIDFSERQQEVVFLPLLLRGSAAGPHLQPRPAPPAGPENSPP